MSDYLEGKAVRKLHAGLRAVTDPVVFTDASTTLFNVVGGRVLVKQILGVATTAVEDDAITMQLQIDPDVGAAAAFTAATSIRNDALGTRYAVAGFDVTEDIVISTDGMAVGDEFILPIGEINALRSAARTGAIQWEIFYVPIDDGAYIEVA